MRQLFKMAQNVSEDKAKWKYLCLLYYILSKTQAAVDMLFESGPEADAEAVAQKWHAHLGEEVPTGGNDRFSEEKRTNRDSLYSEVMKATVGHLLAI
jgi:hypothetical protein